MLWLAGFRHTDEGGKFQELGKPLDSVPLIPVLHMDMFVITAHVLLYCDVLL